jgi:Ice-binding-like/PEP-CTERM motif
MQRSTALFALGFISLSATSMKADQLNVLGTADSFAVLGASTVTNTGSTVLNGNLGLDPGSSITGFPPGTVTAGSIYINDGTAQIAQADALSGFNALALLSTSQNLTGTDLGGLLLAPGIYTFDSAAQLTGEVTLDFEGLSNQSFVFQVGDALTTASASSVNVINGGTNDSIYWEVGSSATLGTTSAFEGDLIASQSITLTTGATIGCGSAIALNAAVTLDTNTIGGGCDAIYSRTTDNPTDPINSGGSGTSPVPEPGTFSMLAIGLATAAGAFRRRLYSLQARN